MATARKPTGKLFVICAPSGAGKTTITARLREHYGVRLWVSCTTRPPRPAERERGLYHFVSTDAFTKMRDEGAFLEWAKVYDYYYGTPRRGIKTWLATGRSVFLEVDVAGAKQVREQYPDAVLIFIMPPSLSALRRRLDARATESREVKERRLAAASKEIAQKDIFDHVVINDKVHTAAKKIMAIVKKHEAR